MGASVGRGSGKVGKWERSEVEGCSARRRRSAVQAPPPFGVFRKRQEAWGLSSMSVSTRQRERRPWAPRLSACSRLDSTVWRERGVRSRPASPLFFQCPVSPIDFRAKGYKTSRKFVILMKATSSSQWLQPGLLSVPARDGFGGAPDRPSYMKPHRNFSGAGIFDGGRPA
jgi:hypothetical protein